MQNIYTVSSAVRIKKSMAGTDGQGDGEEGEDDDKTQEFGEIERKTYFEDKVHVPSGK